MRIVIKRHIINIFPFIGCRLDKLRFPQDDHEKISRGEKEKVLT